MAHSHIRLKSEASEDHAVAATVLTSGTTVPFTLPPVTVLGRLYGPRSRTTSRFSRDASSARRNRAAGSKSSSRMSFQYSCAAFKGGRGGLRAISTNNENVASIVEI